MYIVQALGFDAKKVVVATKCTACTLEAVAAWDAISFLSFLFDLVINPSPR